ncbi:hypothetical protein GCM10010219_41020 [Streptomyces netropsis]|nr:hypothetical protein GCM10010219_41020 [Streptomyces netropsis]
MRSNRHATTANRDSRPQGPDPLKEGAGGDPGGLLMGRPNRATRAAIAQRRHGVGQAEVEAAVRPQGFTCVQNSGG